MDFNRSKLHKFIIEHFSDDELRILCSIEFRSVYDDFSEGWGKKRKAMELIEWCERHEQRATLLTVLQRERPRSYKTIFGKASIVGSVETETIPVGKSVFKTGDSAPDTGRYEFVKYTDDTALPAPTAKERIIPLSRGETFPPIRSANKGAWWRKL